MSSTNTTSNDPKTTKDELAPPAPTAAEHGGGKDAVTKTVQTVEVKESVGQEPVLKPTKVVHQIPADQAKDAPKQD
ncbi:uncharacterized protein [Oryza sativa Japonica Group]|uniref:Os09g0109600 protein n=6 Tax=Oryza TaxID=4527 RepID=A3BW00_ORYSJ|nr:uncharacterized protein LOC4346387 [Oryza sativa Japonica Group]ABR26185.1 unknown [Oryza sativa Indica Group]ACD93451.1 unknown [Oryza sativa Indica Group]EAZ08106.1 hypothetical protein OsI_30371 [Oryza sativa Indica Group]EAZ43739.1 hypothetical protein OsJ_28362 [Oryza sativa Japonica Group]KAF2915089.1 hypothetical protein DAI22_09g005300 [Oryza sativa Japonica Group]|eukprot:NP_001062567.1 Os09g0109600 [Oryza sativa Japonica Group]